MTAITIGNQLHIDGTKRVLLLHFFYSHQSYTFSRSEREVLTMDQQFERELSDILTCPQGDVDNVYDRVLDLFRKQAGVGLMTFFRAADVDGKIHYDGMRNQGDPEAVRFAQSIDGEPLLKAPTLDVQLPPRNEINAFVSQDADTPKFDGSPVKKGFLDPLEIHSAARILVYRGEQFVGWLGCFRRGDQPRCDRELRRDLEPLRKPICAALSAADQLHRGQIDIDEGFALFSPTGRLEFASPKVTSFLDGDHRDELVHIVKELDGGDLEKCIQVVGGVEIRVTRMEGGGAFRYLVQFLPPRAPRLHPAARLTPAQREVVEYAIAGATNVEIAEATDRSTETVKVHLRNIYDHLDISGRVELVSRMQQ